MVLDVMGPHFVLVLDVVEPMLCLWFLMLWNHVLFLVFDVIETLFVGGFREVPPCLMLLAFILILTLVT